MPTVHAERFYFSILDSNTYFLKYNIGNKGVLYVFY